MAPRQPIEKVHPGYGRPLRSKYCVALPRRIARFDSVARLVFGHNDSASPAERLYQRTASRVAEVIGCALYFDAQASKIRVCLPVEEVGQALGPEYF